MRVKYGALLSAVALLSACGRQRAPEVEKLWTANVPESVGDTEADTPTVEIFPAPNGKGRGAGMLICPGGAYKMLQSTYEGEEIAHWLNSFGVAGFVLKYRIAPRYRYPAPMIDAQRAMRYVRANAARFGVRADRVGIIGFSAGGHLASTVLTHFDQGDKTAADAVERVSSRPDFAILGYPIITLRKPWTHDESVRNLLGSDPAQAMIEELSNELHVTRDTPPTFLFHTNQDTAVPPENSILFYQAMRRAGVPVELHIFEEGPHGVGLADGRAGAPMVQSLRQWPELARRWLEKRLE